jgi:hypothetical protein
MMQFKVKRVITKKHPQTDETLHELYKAPDDKAAIETEKSKHPHTISSEGWFLMACKEDSDLENLQQ